MLKNPKNEEKEQRMQSEEMSCKEGIQQILSIRFRYGFFFFDFFLSFFSFFAVCFLSLHNKSLRKAFQFK